MSLQSRLGALISAIGADIKALKANTDTLHQTEWTVFIQPTAPTGVLPTKYLWVNISADPPTLFVEDGVP